MERINAARALFEQFGIDALLVQKAKNRRFLSGFSGSAGTLAVLPARAALVTDGRYLVQARRECASAIDVQLQDVSLGQTLGAVVGDAQRIGVEQDAVTFEQWGKLAAALPGKQLVPVLLDGLRCVKDQREIRCIEEAVRIADAAFARLIGELRPGMAERQAAARLEYFLRDGGADGLAFSTIVASGARSALPHGQPTQKRLQPGDFVTFDFGAVYSGYCSDITRTVVIGRVDCWQKQLYASVLDAQLAALAAVRPGIRANEVDAVARERLRQSGHLGAFNHGLGHSLGLAIHEEPRFSPTCDVVLQPGMVMTVEPGAYYAGIGGVRIEDVVVVTETGCRILTQTDKQLLEIG